MSVIKKFGRPLICLLVTASVAMSVVVPVNAQSPEEYVSSFVERMYTMVLGRTADPTGMSYWTAGLLNGTETGASCALGFFDSNEYKAGNHSDESYVSDLYRVILGRDADPSGLSYWQGYLAGGTPRTYVLAGFVGSDEFGGICSSYGITRGELPMDPSQAITGTAGTIIREDGDMYLRTPEGSIFTGWGRIGNNRYYFDPADGGRAATGWTFINGLKYYFDVDHKLIQNVDPIIGRQSSYLVTINCATETIMIYAQDTPGGEYNIPVRAMLCSTGRAGFETVQGTFPIRRGSVWGELQSDGMPVYGRYTCQISGNYLFHSSWYYTAGDINSLSVRQFNRLGNQASHGCVRLCTSDAKWIYDNCAGTSNVYIFTSNEEAPFDRPTLPQAIVVSGDRGRDPTFD